MNGLLAKSGTETLRPARPTAEIAAVLRSNRTVERLRCTSAGLPAEQCQSDAAYVLKWFKDEAQALWARAKVALRHGEDALVFVVGILGAEAGACRGLLDAHLVEIGDRLSGVGHGVEQAVEHGDDDHRLCSCRRWPARRRSATIWC
jgi:hypothetical protein